jgi:nicotinamidase-related amidase
MASPGLPPRNNPQAEDCMALLLAHWRAAQLPVVHVRHMSRSPASVFWPGQVGAEFQERFIPLAQEHVVEKNITCAFLASSLERWLRVRGIKTVVLVGVSTNFSVEASARTSSQLGFKTMVVSDAAFTFDMQDVHGQTLSADAVHNMALANLHHEYATVLETQQVLVFLPELGQVRT